MYGADDGNRTRVFSLGSRTDVFSAVSYDVRKSSTSDYECLSMRGSVAEFARLVTLA